MSTKPSDQYPNRDDWPALLSSRLYGPNFRKKLCSPLSQWSGGCQPRKGNLLWKSQFVQDLSIEDSGSALSIGFKPHDIIQFPKPRPDRDQLGSDIYYVPESPKEVTFDSFIMNNGVLYIFQFTIMDSHPIKGDLVDFFLYQSL